MTIDITQLRLDISKVIGDQQNQYSIERDLEIKNTIIDLTTNHKFYWNIERVSGITHTNGTLQLPSNTAKVLQLYDSDGNTSYMATPPTLFWVRYDNFIEQGANSRGNEKPFLRQINKTTGVEEIIVYSGSSTNSSLTFNMVRTVYYSDIETWLPDRIYPYILGKVVYKLLNRVDNPDSQLLQVYSGMALDALKAEINFTANSDFNEYNYKVVNNQRAINTNSYGV